eukprot:CAMPEP_0204518950 /NCGR_PEP_ID=MMETSP0661-20131031/4468_1 /ASSEMBLY_ACC=CAM_ASM_000606 /TAXON_ID=109239 /ORGANISM="Alexandrium margalefi, Strain AMGDE01CS-322" /LENGTH=173 /DNA_ID=CAMNT_0051524427 /DNA_START=57 /DNA_END=578 /DNA_ORIENTATION=-
MTYLGVALAVLVACPQALAMHTRSVMAYPIPSDCTTSCAPCKDTCYDDCFEKGVVGNQSKGKPCQDCLEADNGCTSQQMTDCATCAEKACDEHPMAGGCVHLVPFDCTSWCAPCRDTCYADCFEFAAGIQEKGEALPRLHRRQRQPLHRATNVRLPKLRQEGLRGTSRDLRLP